MSRQKLELNAPFDRSDIQNNINNKVVCKRMNDPASVKPGTPGIVTRVSEFGGEKIYEVKWKTGRILSLIDGYETVTTEDPITKEKKQVTKRIDEWWKVIEPESETNEIQERLIITKKRLMEMDKNLPKEFLKFSRLYDMTLIHEFLENLRKSSVINMGGSSPYLYMGKSKIKSLHDYDINHGEMSNERKKCFEKVLELSELVKNELINGARKQIEKDDTEYNDAFFSKLSRKVERDSSEIFRIWMKFYGKERFKP